MREIDKKLFQAIRGRSINSVTIKNLISEGADINARNTNGKTPLDLVNLKTRQYSFYKLRKLGGKLSNEIDMKPEYIYDFKAKLKDALGAYIEDLSEMNHKRKQFAKDEIDFSRLTEKQMYLYVSSIDLSWDFDEQSLIHLAAQYGDYDIVEFLLRNGEDPNPADIDGQTPLDHAYQYNNEDVAELLKSYGGEETDN